MALRLRAYGLTRVWPLAGGLDAWRERGFPLEPWGAVQTPATGTDAA